MRALLITLAAGLPLLGAPAIAGSQTFTYSQQDVLNGASAVMASANYGKGVVFGDIDTGIAPQWVGFTAAYNGQSLANINTANSGVCLNTSSTTNTSSSNGCTAASSPTDGNGHGTFTASEMVGGVLSKGLVGMAPAATLISVQVLSASGSGYSNDVSNGIVYAVNHGAQVLNLSLGPSGSASSQAAFYQSLATAVNYAASKNVYVVFAGGNSSQAFSGGANITGFTNAALQHMLFMGSTNASETLSTFSNKPGTGYFTSTTSTKYNYSSMWLMADGENIYGASNANSVVNGVNCTGYTCMVQMSGTSMAAPQGAGAIGLLLAKWPVLITNGKAAQLLESTGTYLGGSGVNATYGEGYLNLSKAFSAIGTVTVMPVTGGPIAIGGASMLSGGALGTLSNVASNLTSYTTFNSYQRNFTMNVSTLIQAKSAPANIVAASSNAQAFTTTAHLADGSTFTFTGSPTGPSEDSGSMPSHWSSTLTLPSGTTVSTGNGMPASASFAGALWGGDSAASVQTSTLGASNALLDLAPGGAFAAYGTQTGNGVRFAFAWSATPEVQVGQLGNNWATPDASAATAGASWTMMDGWKAGLTFGTLGEHNGLLGSNYAPGGALNFGSQNRSLSFGASSAFDLGGKLSLMVDAAVARAGGSNLSGSIVSSVSDLYARSIGAGLIQADAFAAGDAVSLTARAPLRVFAGSAELAQATVDAQGLPVLSQQRVGLAPNGTEVDIAAGYKAPLGEDSTWNLSLEGRIDPNNVAGTYDITAMLGAKFHL